MFELRFELARSDFDVTVISTPGTLIMSAAMIIAVLSYGGDGDWDIFWGDEACKQHGVCELA